MPPPNLYAAAPAKPPLKRLFISFLPYSIRFERKPFTSISFRKSAINVPVPRDFVPLSRCPTGFHTRDRPGHKIISGYLNEL